MRTGMRSASGWTSGSTRSRHIPSTSPSSRSSSSSPRASASASRSAPSSGETASRPSLRPPASARQAGGPTKPSGSPSSSRLAEMLRSAWKQLPLRIEHKAITRMVRPHRTTAIVELEGNGEQGYGEEVTFQLSDLLPARPQESWEFSGTFGEFSVWLASLDLFDQAPEYD